MRVHVNEEICLGCEACVEVCPELFEMRGEMAVSKIEDDIPEDLEDLCKETAESCPVESIILEEE